MSDHLPECPMLDEQYPKHPLEDCPYCNMLRACEQRIGNVISASLVGGYDWRHGYLAGLDAAREAVLKNHRPVPVIECACWWGKDCPECGSQSNRIVGYACDACCNSSGDHAYCDDMHYDDDTPLHHQDGLWTGPHCPIIASIDALREKP